MREFELDRQLLRILDAQDIGLALHEGNFDGRPIGALPALRKLAPVILRHAELCLALVLYRPDAPYWAPVVLTQVGDKLYRIAMDHRTCANCHWRGYVGTVAPSDLYIGIPDPSSARERAMSAPTVGCPACMNVIESRVVWTERGETIPHTQET